MREAARWISKSCWVKVEAGRAATGATAVDDVPLSMTRHQHQHHQCSLPWSRPSVGAFWLHVWTSHVLLLLLLLLSASPTEEEAMHLYYVWYSTSLSLSLSPTHRHDLSSTEERAEREYRSTPHTLDSGRIIIVRPWARLYGIPMVAQTQLSSH